MASVELNAAATEEHQHASELPPSEEDHSHTLAALNFSQLTPSKFGISVQSFNPSSSSNRKDKSRLAQLKARRRSNIGVRGSPETNSLIRFLAQQRSKTPPASQTAELVRNSPFPPRCASSLRQKMASFQSLMDVEESEVCDPASKQDGNSGGSIETRDYLSDGETLDEEKENRPTLTEPPRCKRRRVAPIKGCEEEIREASAPTLHISLKEQEADVVTRGASNETGEEARALPSPESESDPGIPPAQFDLQPPGSHVLQSCTPTKQQQESVFELQSPTPRHPEDPRAAPPSPPFHVPSQLGMKSTEGDDSTGTSAIKKKRVRFGGPLSPELYDKDLPPSTPLRRGGTPARAPTPGGASELRSLLKTPQGSERQTPQAQPDFVSPSAFGASPTFAMPRVRRMQWMDEDSEETYGAIAFPPMEDLDSDSDVSRDAELACRTQLMDLNAAFHDEALSEIPTDLPAEPEAKPSLPSQMDESEALPETEVQPDGALEAPVRSSSRKKKAGPERDSTAEAPARSSRRKRKQPEESEPVKRSARSAARSASEKMKTTSKSPRRWNKDVDRSLYGSRAYASKNPALSPISESSPFIGESSPFIGESSPFISESSPFISESSPFISESSPFISESSPFISQSPERPQSPSRTHAAQEQKRLDEPISSDAVSGPTAAEDVPNGVLSATDVAQEMGNVAATDAPEAPSESSVASPTAIKRSRAGRGRRRMKQTEGSRARKEVGARRRKLSEEPQAPQEAEQETGGDQTAKLEEFTQNSCELFVPHNDGICILENCSQTLADAARTDTNLNVDRALKVPASADPPLGEEEFSNAASLSTETNRMESAQINDQSGSGGSVSSVIGSGREEERQSRRDVEENVLREQRSVQQESSSCSRPEVQVEESSGGLAPWQADFNFEDVFKPVATRGQRSVRRSLRNHGNAAPSGDASGLAWQPWTSPESSRDARRRTRGRRLSAALLERPSLHEETTTPQ